MESLWKLLWGQRVVRKISIFFSPLLFFMCLKIIFITKVMRAFFFIEGFNSESVESERVSPPALLPRMSPCERFAVNSSGPHPAPTNR